MTDLLDQLENDWDGFVESLKSCPARQPGPNDPLSPADRLAGAGRQSDQPSGDT